MNIPLFMLKLEGNPRKLVAIDLEDKAEFNSIQFDKKNIFLITNDGKKHKVIEFYENIEPSVEEVERITDNLFIEWSEVSEKVFRAEYETARKSHH